MNFAPSAALLREIGGCDRCGSRGPGASARENLCQEHRSRWNLEVCSEAAESTAAAEVTLDGLARDVLRSERGGVALLTALRKHMDAVRLVWDAHQRGALVLPSGVAEAVHDAQRQTPSFLGRIAPPSS
jgi:hypothetical protein